EGWSGGGMEWWRDGVVEGWCGRRLFLGDFTLTKVTVGDRSQCTMKCRMQNEARAESDLRRTANEREWTRIFRLDLAGLGWTWLDLPIQNSKCVLHNVAHRAGVDFW